MTKNMESKRDTDVEHLTRKGADSLNNHDFKSALIAFKRAFKYSKHSIDERLRRVCAFNVGAAYLASGNPKKALEVLHYAIPPQNVQDNRSNGDLFFNFGLAYESLQQKDKATKYLELAVEEFEMEGDKGTMMVGETASKLGQLYRDLNQWSDAIRIYQLGGKAYKTLNQIEQHLMCLCHQATCHHHTKQDDKAVEIANDCVILAQRVQNETVLACVYNDLGLTYTQCHEFSKAATCFELALPLSQVLAGNQQQSAIILQNLGAIYNSLGNFQKAIELHRQAADLHEKLGNKGMYSESLINLAYAYSQLEQLDEAGQIYQESLNIAKETGDARTQWQALEALGAVAFHLGDHESAVLYYKTALKTLTSVEDQAYITAQERILGKLTDTLEVQLADAGIPITPRSTIDQELQRSLSLRSASLASSENDLQIKVNDITRHSSIIRRGKKMSRMKRPKPQPYNNLVALGVGTYDEESDLSLSHSSLRESVKKSEAREQQRLKLASLENSRRYKKHAPMNDVDGDTSDSDPYQTRARIRLPKPNDANDRFQRRNIKPLLRTESHNSIVEYKRHMREVKHRGSFGMLSSASDKEQEKFKYDERLRPPPTPSTASVYDGLPSAQETAPKIEMLEQALMMMKNVIKIEKSPNLHRHRLKHQMSNTLGRLAERDSNHQSEDDSNTLESSSDADLQAVAHEMSRNLLENEYGYSQITHNQEPSYVNVNGSDEYTLTPSNEDSDDDREERNQRLRQFTESQKNPIHVKDDTYLEPHDTYLEPKEQTLQNSKTHTYQEIELVQPNENYFRQKEQHDIDGPSTSNAELLDAENPVLYSQPNTLRKTDYNDNSNSNADAEHDDEGPTLPPRNYISKDEQMPNDQRRSSILTQDSSFADAQIAIPNKKQKKTGAKSRMCVVM